MGKDNERAWYPRIMIMGLIKFRTTRHCNTRCTVRCHFTIIKEKFKFARLKNFSHIERAYRKRCFFAALLRSK